MEVVVVVVAVAPLLRAVGAEAQGNVGLVLRIVGPWLAWPHRYCMIDTCECEPTPYTLMLANVNLYPKP